MVDHSQQIGNVGCGRPAINIAISKDENSFYKNYFDPLIKRAYVLPLFQRPCADLSVGENVGMKHLALEPDLGRLERVLLTEQKLQGKG